MYDPSPDAFGHYQIALRPDGALWELGRGAMGVTYKAQDVHLKCPVALKVLKTECDPRADEQIVREARLAAQLRHRNIASVFYLGLEPGRSFYAMELIEGATVEALVRRNGPMSPRRALHIARQVAIALGAASRHGVVHRDIKPANIMILDVEDEDGPVVKVIDFGLVCPTRGGSGIGEGFAGTARYSSPEQAQERAVDIRSDLYSLGCVMWFLLTGAPPFTGSLAAVFSQHLQSDPPWSKLPPVSKPLRNLLAHLLQKDPAKRPPTPAAARGEIDRCLALAGRQEALAARLAGLRRGGQRWLSAPSRTYATGAACAIPLLCVALVLGRGSLPRTPDAPAPIPGLASAAAETTFDRADLLPNAKPFWSSAFVRRLLLEEEADAARLADSAVIPRDLGSEPELHLPIARELWDSGVPAPYPPWGAFDAGGLVGAWGQAEAEETRAMRTAVVRTAPKAEKRRATSSTKRRTARGGDRGRGEIDVLASLEKARRSIRGFVRQIF